ncbi:MAG: hypothetical protein ACRD8Z_14620, partial [Nitrososphaeraceae archaeon]
ILLKLLPKEIKDDYFWQLLRRLARRSIIKDNHLLWMGKRNHQGYGEISFNNRTVRIGRLICFMFHGMKLDDTVNQANHILECRYRHCWAPAHLYVGTHSDNMLDAFRAGTLSLVNRKRKG